MSEELNLVKDLALILISAGVFTIVSKALKQPLILGYIVAGFLVGPHMGFFPSITSTETVDQWSEIGIIFLMFALGLDFSIKKMIKVGSSALIIAGCKFVGIFLLGFIVGRAMDWTSMESIFLGGLLSMSSTAIVIKAYDDMGLNSRPYAPLVFGTLVFEDIIAILLMVLLSTLAVSNSFAGGEMLFNLAKLAFFLILWFLVGIYMLPILLKKAKAFLTDEILLIVSIGLCFGMVSLAQAAGFSSALGAFVMGSILAETLEGERILELIGGIKNLFSAIFFVSVGMMVDPHVIMEHWGVVLVLVTVVIAGHIFFSFAGAILAGQGIYKAIHTGFSLSQLGEFGFILAGLGTTLGVMRGFIYPIVVAVSVITTFTTPYMIRLASPAEKWLMKTFPDRWISIMEPSENSSDTGSKAARNEWKKLLRSYIMRVVMYGVILLAIVICSDRYLDGFIDRILPDWGSPVHNIICTVITLLVMTPFLFGLAVQAGSMNVHNLLKEKEENIWPVLSLILLRIAIAMSFVVVVIASHFTLSYWSILLIILTGGAFLFFARRSVHKFNRFEQRFFENLNEKELEQRRQAPIAAGIRDTLEGYDVHLERISVNPDSVFAGQMLRDVPIRSASGANIIKIERGSANILIPGASEYVYPCDTLLAVGTTAQIEALRNMMESGHVKQQKESQPQEFTVDMITLSQTSPLVGKNLIEADLRASGCMLISIMRDGQLAVNPKPDLIFAPGDMVWIAGEKSSINWYI